MGRVVFLREAANFDPAKIQTSQPIDIKLDRTSSGSETMPNLVKIRQARASLLYSHVSPFMTLLHTCFNFSVTPIAQKELLFIAGPFVAQTLRLDERVPFLQVVTL